MDSSRQAPQTSSSSNGQQMPERSHNLQRAIDNCTVLYKYEKPALSGDEECAICLEPYEEGNDVRYVHVNITFYPKE